MDLEADQVVIDGYGSAAQLYRDVGWDAPLPLPTGQKCPPPSGFTGHDGAVPTSEQVSTWCSENLEGNLCLRLPEGVVGIDVDGYGQKTGAQTLAEAERQWGSLPLTYRSSSRGDDSVSGIRMFRVPSGTFLRSGINFPDKKIGDIDLIQRPHRYAVVCPSVHPDTGDMYRWFGPDGALMAAGEVPRVDELPTLPETWVEALSKDAVRSNVFDGSAPNRPKLDSAVIDESLYGRLVALEDTGEPDRVIGDELNRAIRRLMDPVGSRHDNTRDDVARLMRLHHAGRAGVPRALAQLHNLFVQEVSDTRSAKAATAEFGRLVEGAAVLIAASGVEENTNSAAAEEKRPHDDFDRFVSGGSFILDRSDEMPAIWGDGDRVLWPDGEGLMIAGPQGLGKSTLAQQLALTLIGLLDEPVLGLPILGEPKRVLYLAMDRPKQIERSFRRICITADKQLLDEGLVVWPGPPPRDLAVHPELLTVLAEKADADIVIVDSLKDAALALSSEEAGAGWNRAVQKLLVSGRNILVLHHTKKQSGSRSNALDEIYGSTWLTAGMGSVIGLRGEAGDSILKFHHDKTPMVQIPSMQIHHDQQNGLMLPVVTVDLVDLARREGGVTVERAAQVLFETDEPSDRLKENARRRLNRLAESEKLELTKQGHKSVYLPRN